MSWFTFRHEAMATFFEVAVAGQPEAYAGQAAAAAFREVDRLERELSRFVETSDIARANRLAAGESIVIGADTLECLLVAADVSVATGGAFDPAYASVCGRGAPPESPLYSLDSESHRLISHAATLALDLGAVGKGYALDRAADVLRDWEVNAACVVAGGSTVLALDPPPATAGWPIGIGDAPHGQTIPLARIALSASGTAVRGAHLMDPRTGVPALRQSRTWALAPNAAQSDALSTAFFVLSDAEVAAFCASYPQIGAAMVRPEGGMSACGALRRLLDQPPRR